VKPLVVVPGACEHAFAPRDLKTQGKTLRNTPKFPKTSKSGISSIAVTDHDPKRAAAMARAYVEVLDRLVAQVSTSSTRRERILLVGRLQKPKADLDTAAKHFSDFASRNTAIDIAAQGKAMMGPQPCCRCN
jgi:capsule polysaccharide export protein KpsE/RkpR